MQPHAPLPGPVDPLAVYGCCSVCVAVSGMLQWFPFQHDDAALDHGLFTTAIALPSPAYQ